MIIKMRYETDFETFEIDVDAASKWVNITMEPEETQEEFEKRIQDVVDKEYNRPEYNIWHRETRHIDDKPKARRLDGKPSYIGGSSDDLNFDVMDYLAITDPFEDFDYKTNYEEQCEKLCTLLKPEAADLVIKIVLDGQTARELAEEVVDASGLTDDEYDELLTKEANKISKKYRRALNNLKNIF